MPSPPAFQWYPKQWLGDDKVLAMDWDARAMHFHLINLAWQQEPPCSLPDDMDAIRRWLGLPLGSVDSDQTWRRVRPQIFAAWSLRDDRRWYQVGLVRVWERQQRRSNAGTNNVRKRYQSHEVEERSDLDVDSKSKPKSCFNEQEVSLMVMTECHLSGKHIQQTIETQLLNCKDGDLRNNCERMITAINEYKSSGGTKIFLWLSEGGWLNDPRGQHGKPTYETAQERRSRNNDAAIITAMRSRVIARTEGNGEDVGHGSGPTGGGGVDAGVRERQPGSSQMVLSPMAQRERNAPNPSRNTKVGA